MNSILKKSKEKISPYVTNLGGWKTDRKIVVIESDDWGSIRMPSLEVYKNCLEAGYRVDRTDYEKYDSLASEDDLEHLFELLKSFKDINGNHPVITANTLTSNPDFERIKESDFSKYYFEPITETFKKYPHHRNAFYLWQKGIQEGVFFPQSHGREHLNVSKFMNALKRGDSDALFGFQFAMPGSIPHGNKPAGNKYLEALNYSDVSDKKDKLKIILEGLDLFESLFGYRSESFIPPTYLWSTDFDQDMSKNGVKFYQGLHKMKERRIGKNPIFHNRKLGDRNKYNQYYLVRNVTFEPTQQKNKNIDYVGECLSRIRASFRMKKPAIIGSHRLNYVGYLVVANRDRSLYMLDNLFKSIQKEWPETEFMNSVQLGKLIASEDQRK